MADFDWSLVKTKFFNEITAPNFKVTQKEYTTSQGHRQVFRSLNELAQLNNIQRNIDAQEERDLNGIISLSELDYTS